MKNYPINLKIISLIALITFTFTQLSWGYEGRVASSQPQRSHLRGEQAKGNGVGDEIVGMLDGANTTSTAGVSAARSSEAKDTGIDLEKYLYGKGNNAEEIKRVKKVIETKNHIVIEIGAGGALAARRLADKYPELGVIATDKYDIKDTSKFYAADARRWANDELAAQRNEPDNLVIIRAEPDIFNYILDNSIDYILFVQGEIEPFNQLQVFLNSGLLQAKLKEAGQFVVVNYIVNERESPIRTLIENYGFEEMEGMDSFLGVSLSGASTYAWFTGQGQICFSGVFINKKSSIKTNGKSQAVSTASETKGTGISAAANAGGARKEFKPDLISAAEMAKMIIDGQTGFNLALRHMRYYRSHSMLTGEGLEAYLLVLESDLADRVYLYDGFLEKIGLEREKQPIIPHGLVSARDFARLIERDVDLAVSDMCYYVAHIFISRLSTSIYLTAVREALQNPALWDQFMLKLQETDEYKNLGQKLTDSFRRRHSAGVRKSIPFLREPVKHDNPPSRSKIAIDAAEIIEKVLGRNSEVFLLFEAIYSNTDFRDELFPLLARFIEVPGMKDILSRLAIAGYPQSRDINNITGLLAEVYYAGYLKDMDYDIVCLAFKINSTAENRDLLEVDLLVRDKDGRFYFVEVKHGAAAKRSTRDISFLTTKEGIGYVCRALRLKGVDEDVIRLLSAQLNDTENLPEFKYILSREEITQNLGAVPDRVTNGFIEKATRAEFKIAELYRQLDNVIKMVKEKFLLQKFVAVVIDENQESRENIANEIESYWMFDQVLSVADETIAIEMEQALQKKNIEIKFIRIQHSGDIFSLGMDGFGVQIFDFESGITNAMQSYLESI